MKMFYAGTGESYDFEMTLLALIMVFAFAVIFSWGIPWFRNYLKLRREARVLSSESLTEQEDDGSPQDVESWHSVPIR